MKKLLLIIAATVFSTALFAGSANVTLEGTGKCGKCALKVADKCTNVLEVAGDDGNPIIFTFAKNVKHGDFFCQGETPGLVVKGKFKQVDGEMILVATSVEEKEG